MNKTQPDTVREEFSCEEWKSSPHCRSAYYLVREQQTNKPNLWVTNANLLLRGKRDFQFSDSAVLYFQSFWLKFDFRIKRNLRKKTITNAINDWGRTSFNNDTWLTTLLLLQKSPSGRQLDFIVVLFFVYLGFLLGFFFGRNKLSRCRKMPLCPD